MLNQGKEEIDTRKLCFHKFLCATRNGCCTKHTIYVCMDTHRNILQSISGCLSMNVQRENETDQSKSPTSSGTAILIGQFGLPFYIHGTSNLKSMVLCMHTK